MYRRKNGKWLNQKGETINMEEKETTNINENSKEKNTLFTILNHERVDLTIEEIFDSNRFYEIKAVTFSAEESFLNKYLTPFRNVDLIIGIQDTDVQARGIMALKNETRNLIESQKRIIKKEQIKFFENLSRENQENFVKEKWKLRVPINSTIHSKFYLLRNDSETRLILGSANLSFQAFSNKRNQFENIIIFDNSQLFYQFEKYFDEISLTCTDFITSAIKKKAESKIKIMNENIDKNQEEMFSVKFTNDESAKLQIDISKDVIKNLNEVIVKEEDEIALPIIEEIKTIDEKHRIIENDQKEAVEIEKFAYELSVNTISKQAKKKESLIVTPETFAKKIKPKLEVKIATRLNQATPERELLFSKDTDRGFGRSGLYIEENGGTKPFGQKAGKEEIKNSVESIIKLIDNYKKYVIDYNDNYGSRILEIILYAFTSPFIQDIRFKLESDSEKLDVPQFLFIGGTAGSGKSNLLQILQKMLGLSKSKPILYNNIIPTGRTKKADTITQIQLWMSENNVAPILIDEIDEEFFSNKDRGNKLIVNVSNLSTSNYDFTPCFIGTTNALEYSLPQRSQRRSYYVKNDKVFDTELKKKSVKAYTEVLEMVNDTLFQDFVMRFAEKLTDDNLNWKNYSLHSSTGLIDFLYWSREIFKEYFEIAQMEVPAWFPETRYDDTVENNQSLWRKLYEYNYRDFKPKEDKSVYLFKLKSLDSEDAQSNRYGTKVLPSIKYLNALSQKCKNDNNSSDIIEIKIKEFHDWIGVPVPKELEHKKTFFDFFKKNKNEK